MVKVVTAGEMARLERYAYALGEQESWMRCAGHGVADVAESLLHEIPTAKVVILCGTGNNGGDGYVAAQMLMQRGYSVTAVALGELASSSSLCTQMRTEFVHRGGEVVPFEGLLPLMGVSLIIDGLFGTGFHGTLPKSYCQAIEQANSSSIPILAIDIPSGINGTTGCVEHVSIQAHTTLCLGFPKWGCVSKAAWNAVGQIILYDFGIRAYEDQAQEQAIWLESHGVASLLPPLVRCRHKYEAGFVVGIGGSAAFSGAPILSSWAALKAGAGLVTLWHPQDMPLHQLPLEIIHCGFTEATDVRLDDRRIGALFLGPGLLGTPRDVALLHRVFSEYEQPLVLDAGALNLLSTHRLAPRHHSILTPHEGEMVRLLGLDAMPTRFDLIQRCQEYAQTYQIWIVLKGAPTFLIAPDLPPHICPVGDPGMATAGMGDVLTGILASLCAQGCTPWHACLLGSYLHGLAGMLGARVETSYGLLAHDVIAMLPQAFLRLGSGQELFLRTHHL